MLHQSKSNRSLSTTFCYKQIWLLTIRYFLQGRSVSPGFLIVESDRPFTTTNEFVSSIGKMSMVDRLSWEGRTD
jgi:hypothetical protein